jgi:signal transduction histidine kinase/CheY-like chemotaxis protein/PAS domain-containing protein/HPt (histidine-containing phosphotransfer) domain-containing protein
MQNNEGKRLAGVNGFYGFFNVYGGIFLTGDVNWKPPEDYDMQNRPFYIAAVEANGDIGVTPPYYNIASEGETITFVRRIFNNDNQPLAIICLNIFIERVKQHAINTQFAEKGYGFLLNQNMELIAHPDPSLLGVRLHNVRSYIAAYEDELRQNGYIYKIIATDYRGIKSIVFIERLYNGWYMGIVTPNDKYYQTTRNTALFLTMLGTALAVILIIILGRISADKDKADERMRIMFDSMPLGANMHNENFDYFECNDAAVNMFGLSNKQEFREKFFNLWPEYQPDGQLSSEKMAQADEKVLADGYCRFEWTYLNPRGELIPGECTLVRVEHNHEIIVAAYIRDLREIRAAMAEIKEVAKKQADAEAQINQSRQSLNILTNILNSLDAMIYVSVPHTGEILFVNNYMKKQFKIEGDCIGKICYKIFLEGMDGICDFCPCYQLDKEPDSTVVWELRNPITNRMYRNTDRYIEWSDGRNVLIRHSVDVTELITAKEQAVQANKDKSSFLAKMSHEIRTPMNAILGITEIQLENKTLSPETQEAFSEIYNSGYLLMGIINDILDLSKIEAGKLELSPAAYDVPSLINDTVHLNIMRYDSKPIKFKLFVDENIPSTLYGDELRIKQILNNLLSNAFKYTNKGEISFSVAAEYEPQEKTPRVTLVFRVSDTGQGMSAEQLEKLFDEYTRFNTEANRTTVGSGLGMSITKHLVRMMDGKISVDSEPGRGSIFTVHLPQVIISEEVLGSVVAENLKQFHLGKAEQLKKVPQIVRDYMPYGKVLIVDDVGSNLYVARGLMTPYGLSVETASSGFEAIDKIKNGAVYDIIFMDHMMPKMDGIEAVKIIRNMGYTYPIIALTANALTGQSEIFMENGFDGFISKPIDIRQLNLSLNKLVRDKQPPEVLDNARQQALKNNMAKSAITEDQPASYYNLAALFVLDAEKAYESLNKLHSNAYRRADDIQTYVINVHAMKSALANIGETGLSAVALKLEQAGKAKDIKIMMAETPAFLEALRETIEKNKPKEDDSDAKAEYSDSDRMYLEEKMLAIQKACGEYDEKTANKALAELGQRKWPHSIKELLDTIALHLLHSNFEDAAELANNYARGEK